MSHVKSKRTSRLIKPWRERIKVRRYYPEHGHTQDVYYQHFIDKATLDGCLVLIYTKPHRCIHIPLCNIVDFEVSEEPNAKD